MQEQYIKNINRLLNSHLKLTQYRYLDYKINICCTCKYHRIYDIFIDTEAVLINSMRVQTFKNKHDTYDITVISNNDNGILYISEKLCEYESDDFVTFANLYEKYPCFNDNTIKLLMYEFEQLAETYKK